MGDVQFLTYITPSTASLPAEPMQRAVVAERNDYVAGGYQFAVFGRSDQGLVPNPRAAGVIWTSSLTRIDPSAETNSQGTFGAGNGIEVALNNPLTEAVLDALAESDLSWSDAEARALATGMLMDETLIERSAQDAMELWRLGLIKPLAV